jgi:hypothetical protein
MSTSKCACAHKIGSGNRKTSAFAKHNQTNFGGQPNYSDRPAFAAGVASALDEITERQSLLFLMRFH